MSHLLQVWPSPALARLVPWLMDRGSLQDLLLFLPRPGFLILGPALSGMYLSIEEIIIHSLINNNFKNIDRNKFCF